MNDEEAMRLLRSLLEREGVEWAEESGYLRFRAKSGGLLWETACRAQQGLLLIYGRFPFVCRRPERARQICDETNRRLCRGALFLGADGAPVYRCTAELDDVYGAEERIGQALRYSAQVMARSWGPLSGA